VFWWVLVREALATALQLPDPSYHSHGWFRRRINDKDTADVLKTLRVYLDRHPERRIVP